VERTVRQPDWIAPDPKRPGVERRFRVIPEYGGRVMRVACYETESEIRIVTVFLRPERKKAAMTPTVKYRPADNAAYIRFSSAKVLESAEVSPDVIFDYDAEGHIVGIELLDAKAQLPRDVLIEAA
jgi:uncharacterized protein YuzE